MSIRYKLRAGCYDERFSIHKNILIVTFYIEDVCKIRNLKVFEKKMRYEYPFDGHQVCDVAGIPLNISTKIKRNMHKLLEAFTKRYIKKLQQLKNENNAYLEKLGYVKI